MKVVPHSKSVGYNFDNCNEWNEAKNRNQPYLYVNRIIDDFGDKRVILHINNVKYRTGGHYYPQDFEPYIEGDVRMKYKLEDLNSSMLFKLRDYGLCVLLERKCKQNKLMFFYSQSMINSGCYGCLSALSSYNEHFKDVYYSEYDIMAIKQYDSCNEALHMVLNNKEPDSWDWVRVEKTEQETQLENLVEKLQGQLTEAQSELEKIRQK